MKPATPLPWDFVCTELGTIVVASEGVNISPAQPHTWREDDAAYIAHACNAYPKLVEALRACSRAVEGLPSEADKDDARALLRELGEAA